MKHLHNKVYVTGMSTCQFHALLQSLNILSFNTKRIINTFVVCIVYNLPLMHDLLITSAGYWDSCYRWHKRTRCWTRIILNHLLFVSQCNLCLLFGGNDCSEMGRTYYVVSPCILTDGLLCHYRRFILLWIRCSKESKPNFN